ncbi:hypothetical protein JW796_02405 [Candidatus Dojkabacteria bacterium]|nr:hypothetical protein [Candidatus Dojkabacteria bacterium]
MSRLNQLLKKNSKKHLLFLFALSAVVILIAKFFLITNLNSDNEFLRTYKYFTSDGFDWIANGLRFGENSTISFRNPGLPLIIRALSEVNTLRMLPLLNQMVFAGITFTLWACIDGLLKRFSAKEKQTQTIEVFGRKIQLKKTNVLFAITSAVSILFFCNFTMQNFSNFILSDYYAILFICLAVLFLIKGKSNFAILFLCISTSFQNFSFFLILIYELVLVTDFFLKQVIKNKAKDKKSIKLFIKQIFFHTEIILITTGPWFLYKFLLFRNPLYTNVKQLELIIPHANSVLFYLAGAISIFGIPLLLLLAIGFINILLKQYNHRVLCLNIFLFFFFTVIFWVFLYNWNDRRFLLYLIPYVYILSAIGIWSIVFKTQKVNILTWVILFVIFLNGYFFSTGEESLFTWDRVYITTASYYKFESQIDKKAKGEIMFPVELYDTSEGNIINHLEPAFVATILERDKIRYNNSPYNDYFILAESSYLPASETICIEQETHSGYVLNSVMLIQYNRSLKQLKINTHECKN